MTTLDKDQLTWMLKQVLEQPEVYDVMLISGDGLMRACSEGVDRDVADTMAAAVAGLQSTSAAIAGFCRTPRGSWKQSLLEFDGGFVIIMSAAQGSHLAVATSGSADVAQVAFTMHTVVAQLGREMATEPRQDAAV